MTRFETPCAPYEPSLTFIIKYRLAGEVLLFFSAAAKSWGLGHCSNEQGFQVLMRRLRREQVMSLLINVEHVSYDMTLCYTNIERDSLECKTQTFIPACQYKRDQAKERSVSRLQSERQRQAEYDTDDWYGEMHHDEALSATANVR